MRKYILSAVLLGSVFSGSANADLRWSEIVRSDYRLQGISQSDGKPSAQIGVEYHDDVFFIGLWLTENRLISKLQNDNSGVTEAGYYAGYQRVLSNRITLTATATHYDYPFDDRFNACRYNEVQVIADYSQWLAASIGASDRQYNRYDRSTQYLQYDDYRRVNRNSISRFFELTTHQAINDQFVLSAGLGYNDTGAEFTPDYRYWNIGLGSSFRNVNYDLNLIGTDDNAKAIFGKDDAETTLVLSLNISFL